MLALPACWSSAWCEEKEANESLPLSFACTHGPLISSLFSDRLRLDRHALWLNTVLALRPGPFFSRNNLASIRAIWIGPTACASLPAICSQKPESLLSILSHAESCLESMRGRPHLLACALHPSIAIGTEARQSFNKSLLPVIIHPII